MEIINLCSSNSVLNQFIIEMRDNTIQKDSMRFRRNLERLGEIFAYEVSKTLKYKSIDVNTPLGIATSNAIADEIVIASIMRAGLPLHNGILNYFDKAQNSFVAAYRKYGKDNKFSIQVEYASSTDIDGKVLILADTMIATGASIILTYRKLCEKGAPDRLHIVGAIASKEGVDNLAKSIPNDNTTLWVAAIDEELTNKSFIIPGLGDAGDLAYGTKL